MVKIGKFHADSSTTYDDHFFRNFLEREGFPISYNILSIDFQIGEFFASSSGGYYYMIRFIFLCTSIVSYLKFVFSFESAFPFQDINPVLTRKKIDPFTH